MSSARARAGAARRASAQRFDVAAGELSRAATGADLLVVANAYELLAAAAAKLSDAVRLEDQAGHAPRSRSRRSA